MKGVNSVVNAIKFLSTPSARRATVQQTEQPKPEKTISIHALREEGDLLWEHWENMFGISIHALREEGDADKGNAFVGGNNFYPRPPRGGRRWQCCSWQKNTNFYPRPPRGGRQVIKPVRLADRKFLSTPSARRATQDHTAQPNPKTYFYPRPPRGGRRGVPACPAVPVSISIHALREEGDRMSRMLTR